MISVCFLFFIKWKGIIMKKEQIKKALAGIGIASLIVGVGLMSSGCKKAQETGAGMEGVTGGEEEKVEGKASCGSCGKGSCGK